MDTMQTLLADSPNPKAINTWLRYFSTCCTRAVDEADAFEQKRTAITPKTRSINQMETIAALY
ncbi:MAG: hypothetical protein RSN88_06965, partial [Gordonibacter sp.]|uniref:hypothetical protein n=1 Tax=Gordonibacter sp. TaxID=1968902 RepID=UPI002FCBE77D